jgi:glycosyltransferase involved in cell wall biosynthesis
MVSVVIPLFNKAPTVGRAIDSVLAQTCLPAEIIVVNDGSTDGGEGVARDRANAAEAAGVAFRVIDQPNGGVSRARNAGLRAASRPLVAFLDADDAWLPDYLARMQPLIAAHPAAVLYGAGFFTVDNAAAGERKRYHGIGTGPQSTRPAGPVDYFAERLRDFVLHTSTTIARKEPALAIGGFPEGVAYAEDHIFWARLALAGEVVATPEPLSEYDVGVPGQAVAYWNTVYKERFDVLAYHRFLADELRQRARDAALSDSFARFARKELTTCLLHRLWWGRFDAVNTFWRELALDEVSLGMLARGTAFVSRHAAVQPPVAAVIGLLRCLRGSKPARSA